MTGAPTTPPAASLDPLALAQAATAAADGRPVLEVALELAGHARDLADLLARLDDCARFAATIEATELEPSSTRTIVTVRASHDGAEPEQLRTDRGDTAWGRIMADRVTRLTGHRVLVHKALEDAGTDRKVRVLVWADELGGAPPSTTRPAGPASGAQDTGGAPPSSGAPSEHADLVARVAMTLDEASVPGDHTAALLQARYGVERLGALDLDQLRKLAAKLLTEAGIAAFRSAAARDFAAAQQPACDSCGQPAEDLDGAGLCPSCAVPF